MEIVCCGNCKCWEEFTMSQEIRSNTQGFNTFKREGRCIRYPPNPKQPVTRWDDYCWDGIYKSEVESNKMQSEVQGHEKFLIDNLLNKVDVGIEQIITLHKKAVSAKKHSVSSKMKDGKLDNGLSLQQSSENPNVFLLAWDGEIIPGQCAIDCGDLTFGIRNVVVHFEVQDDDFNDRQMKWLNRNQKNGETSSSKG